MLFLGENFVIGILGDPTLWDPKKLNEFIPKEEAGKEKKKPAEIRTMDKVATGVRLYKVIK